MTENRGALVTPRYLFVWISHSRNQGPHAGRLGREIQAAATVRRDWAEKHSGAPLCICENQEHAPHAFRRPRRIGKDNLRDSPRPWTVRRRVAGYTHRAE